MNNWEKKQEAKENELAGRTLGNDSAKKKAELNQDALTLQEHHARSLELAEIEKEIELAEQYLDVGFWNKTLEILKKIIDDPKLKSDQQEKVVAMYAEARTLMEAAALLHPDEVERFGHFNLPTKDVN